MATHIKITYTTRNGTLMEKFYTAKRKAGLEIERLFARRIEAKATYMDEPVGALFGEVENGPPNFCWESNRTYTWTCWHSAGDRA